MGYNITLNSISKRFENSWIFKNVSYEFNSGNVYVLLGNNGSGKSTLMRCIATIHDTNKGSVIHKQDDTNVVNKDKIFKHISYCAPGMELIEEMTLYEFLKFHFSFKNIIKGFSIDSIIEAIELQSSRNVFLRNFSSGMKQRVKLAQALFADVAVVLLDEPCTNLDINGIELYHKLLSMAMSDKQKIVIIASNDPKEYPSTEFYLNLSDYK